MEKLILLNEVTDFLEMGLDMVERVGDCSNLERKVNVKSILWKTIGIQSGLILQTDYLSNKARIVDTHGIQKANGSISAMKEKIERLSAEDFLRPGDVIGTSRGAYEHYAIYLGEGEIVHYAGNHTDFKGSIRIHKAPFCDFLKDSKDYFVVSFQGKYPVKIHATTNFLSRGYLDWESIRPQYIYSPRETVKRALSRVGETQYHLLYNNCEHFAMWCKTGVAESNQINRLVKHSINFTCT